MNVNLSPAVRNWLIILFICVGSLSTALGALETIPVVVSVVLTTLNLILTALLVPGSVGGTQSKLLSPKVDVGGPPRVDDTEAGYADWVALVAILALCLALLAIAGVSID